MFKNILAKCAIVTGETILVTGLNYATNSVVDMYMHPDLKNCNTDQEKADKIKRFDKAKSLIKPIINVVEASLVASATGVALDAIDRKSTTTNADTSEEKSSLIGSNYYLIR